MDIKGFVKVEKSIIIKGCEGCLLNIKLSREESFEKAITFEMNKKSIFNFFKGNSKEKAIKILEDYEWWNKHWIYDWEDTEEEMKTLLNVANNTTEDYIYLEIEVADTIYKFKNEE